MNDVPELVRAEQLLELGRAAEAEQLARTALGQDPSSGTGLELLARSLRQQDRNEEGAQVARAGLGHHPDSPDLQLALVDCLVDLVGGEASGRSRGRRGDAALVDEARATAVRLVRTEPHWWVSHYAHARALLAGDRPRVRDALLAAQHAVRLAPHAADAHNLLGICLDMLKQPEAARAAYQEALRLNPQHALAMNNLATLDVGFFRLRRAARGFRDAAALRPGETLPQQNLRTLTTRLAMRTLVVVLAGAGALAIALAAGAPWWARALLGTCLVAGAVWLVHHSRGYLPRGMTLTWRSLNDAIGWHERLWLAITSSALVCLVAMSFAPHHLAVEAGFAMLFIGRMLLIALIVGGVLGAISGLKRR